MDGAMRTGNKVCKNQTSTVLEPGMWTEYRCVRLPQLSILPTTLIDATIDTTPGNEHSKLFDVCTSR